MRKIVISGGPSTGKSTTFELLQSEYPEAHFVTEAAETVIKNELEKQQEDPIYEPIMPVTNYRKFLPLLIAQQVADEASIPKDAELVFMDRCIIDNLGYLAYNGVTDYIEEVRLRAKFGKYSLAFFCDWLGKFEQTTVRQETEEEGLAVHRHLEIAYHSTDVPIIHLPPVSPVERMGIIRSAIDSDA